MPHSFLEYNDLNWGMGAAMWMAFRPKEVKYFRNNTSNRLESFHGKAKVFLKLSMMLSHCVVELMMLSHYLVELMT